MAGGANYRATISWTDHITVAVKGTFTRTPIGRAHTNDSLLRVGEIAKMDVGA